MLYIIFVIPAVASNINVKFVPDITDILEKCPLWPVLAIIIQCGTVPFTIYFFVGDTVRTPDGVNQPDITSYETFSHD